MHKFIDYISNTLSLLHQSTIAVLMVIVLFVGFSDMLVHIGSGFQNLS